MGDMTVLVWAGPLGVLILIGLAGLAFDRFRRPGQKSRDEADELRQANDTLRYYRDVGDSTNTGGW
jgi:cytochrome c-type biogenesis protein CcmH/NrfF